MTPQSFVEYIKYRKKAKTRHGVHSPFVFDFVEKILRSGITVSPLAVEKYLPINEIYMPLKIKQQLFLLLKHFHSEKVISFIENEQGQVELFLGLEDKGHELQPVHYEADCMLFVLKDPNAWSSLFRMYQNTLSKDSVVIATGIHQSKVHTEQWELLHSKADVKMSLDIFNMGVLLFRDEFKEKQHFILRK